MFGGADDHAPSPAVPSPRGAPPRGGPAGAATLGRRAHSHRGTAPRPTHLPVTSARLVRRDTGGAGCDVGRRRGPTQRDGCRSFRPRGGRYARPPPRPRSRHGCAPHSPFYPQNWTVARAGRRLWPPPRRSLETPPPRAQTAGGLRGGRGRVRRRTGWGRRLGRLTAGAHVGNGGQQRGTRPGSVTGGERRRRLRRWSLPRSGRGGSGASPRPSRPRPTPSLKVLLVETHAGWRQTPKNPPLSYPPRRRVRFARHDRCPRGCRRRWSAASRPGSVAASPVGPPGARDGGETATITSKAAAGEPPQPSPNGQHGSPRGERDPERHPLVVVWWGGGAVKYRLVGSPRPVRPPPGDSCCCCSPRPPAGTCAWSSHARPAAPQRDLATGFGATHPNLSSGG